MSRLNVLFGDNVRLCKVLGHSFGKQGASFESSSAKSRPEITSESALIPAQSCTVAASRTSMLSFPGERSSVQLRVPSKFLAHVKHPSKRVASVSPCPLTNYFQRRYSKSRTAGYKLRHSRWLLSSPLLADFQPIYVGLKNDSTGSAHCERTTQFSQSRARCH